MKAYLINMHLLVPRSRSSAKLKVKYKGYISQKNGRLGAFMFHKCILFFLGGNESSWQTGITSGHGDDEDPPDEKPVEIPHR